ncbi:DUF6479 family protein [Streptomyces fagopyri]|uniref:DUF6479 family protein n=1 Tax=Streptomyces fagopyri TaxID=2662397 RepID=UPI0033E285A2
MLTQSTTLQFTAVSDAARGTLGAFLGGLLVVGALIWAVRLGVKVRRKEPRPPRPDEQPQLPRSGPVHEVRELREPDDVPLAADNSERLKPRNLHASGSKRSANQDGPRWKPGDDTGSSGTGGSSKP